ncbi:uncharacterized protein LOC133404604 [Phycodurus eques]|uniref:uncharacterized protein LOC133404604 n=1 Tax=Phycodurus eques TaxID=693459 RepID=UPI002ACDE77E|nr:uncharacterized protein LOC133404604 [Phycodurus eques]
MAKAPPYWTLRRKSRARVNQHSESIQSSLTSGSTTEEVRVDAKNEFAADVEDHFTDCESSFAEPVEFDESSNSDNNCLTLEDEGSLLGANLTTWAVEENITRSSLNKLLKILKCYRPTAVSDGLRTFQRPRSLLPNTHQIIPSNCTAVERFIVEQLGELHLEVDRLTATLQSLSANRAPDRPPRSNDYGKSLPISTLEELNNFDERLCRDRNFKKRDHKAVHNWGNVC